MSRHASRRWFGIAALVGALALSSTVAAAPGQGRSQAAEALKPPSRSLPTLFLPLRAKLESGNVVPALKVAAPAATGRFDGALVRTGAEKRGAPPTIGWTLSWRLSVSGLTGSVAAAEIRVGSAGQTGPALLSLCAPCRSSGVGIVRNLTKEQVAALRRDALYVNVQTAANPAGEVRGQIARRGSLRAGTPPSFKPLP